MERPLIKLCVVIALIQLATILFMICAAARGNKQAEDTLGGMTPPQSIAVWHRWATPLLPIPLVWIIAIAVASAEDRSPKATLCLLLGGIGLAALLLFEAAKLLCAVIYISGGGCGMSP